MFVLYYLIASFAMMAAGIGIILLTGKTGAALLPCLFMFTLLIPACAVTVRRLHDIGRSAWFLLVSLIPVIGEILLLVVLLSKGIPDTNHYGKKPETTTHNNNYYRIRSASVTLIISSVFWLLSLAIFIFISNSVVTNQMLLSLLLPVGLITVGITLFSKRTFSSDIAWSLIVFSLVWLLIAFFTIQDSLAGLLSKFDVPLLIQQFEILVPVALLISGIYILMKKSDRTVPSCILFAGSCVWLLSIIIKVIQIPDIQRYIPDLASIMLEIVVPVSFMVLARTMLSKNLYAKKSKNGMEEQVVSEKSNAMQPVTELEVEPIFQPEIVQTVEQAAQPEQPEQPEILQMVEQSEQPEIVQIVEPVAQPVPVHKPTPIDDFRKKVVFLREDRDNNNIWIIYNAPTKAIAMMFLSRQRIERPAYFVIVETPEGNFGKDKDGIYQE